MVRRRVAGGIRWGIWARRGRLLMSLSDILGLGVWLEFLGRLLLNVSGLKCLAALWMALLFIWDIDTLIDIIPFGDMDVNTAVLLLLRNATI